MNSRITVAVLFLAVASYAQADCSGLILKGRFEPLGSASWDTGVNFDTGEAIYSKDDGARATRQVGTHSCSNSQISFGLNSGKPVGVPDLSCIGARTGSTVSGRCVATGNHPEERFSGTLIKELKNRVDISPSIITIFLANNMIFFLEAVMANYKVIDE